VAGALAAAGAGSIGLWYQLFRRPLPKTRGRMHVKGLEDSLTIERDERGVARIEARSTHDLCFAWARGGCPSSPGERASRWTA